MIGIRVVHAILVPRTGPCPCGVVVAFLNLENGLCIALSVWGRDTHHSRLSALLALVNPDSSSWDGQVLRLVDVDHNVWTLILVFWRDEHMKSDVTEVKGPATGHEPEDNVLALYGIGVCAGLHNWAELICIRTRLDLEKFRTRFDDFPLVRKPIRECRAIEHLPIFRGEDGCVTWDGIGSDRSL